MYHLTMTPAERASAVAFALKNCALEAMTPGDATMRAAAGYEQGDNDVSALIDAADRGDLRDRQRQARRREP